MVNNYSNSFWRNRVREVANKPMITRGDLGKIAIPLPQTRPLSARKLIVARKLPLVRNSLTKREVRTLTNVSLPKSRKEILSLNRFVNKNPRLTPNESVVKWRTTTGSNTVSGRLAKRWLADKLMGKQVKAKRKSLAKKLNLSTTLRL